MMSGRQKRKKRVGQRDQDDDNVVFVDGIQTPDDVGSRNVHLPECKSVQRELTMMIISANRM